MEEKTTTDATVNDTGVSEETQPVQTEQAEAVQQETTESVEETDAPEQQEEAPLKSKKETSEEEYRSQLDSWATKKGLTLDGDNARKAAEMAMEAERNMHQATHKRSELEKSLSNTSDEYAEQVAQQTGQDPELLKRLQRVEVKEAVRDFWSQEGVDKTYEPKMIELLREKPHLAADLESLYATAVMKSGNMAAVKSQGKREALESLAHKQQAAVPTGSATNAGVTPKAKPFKDLSIEEMEAKLGFARR